jgi:hypothetical protein
MREITILIFLGVESKLLGSLWLKRLRPFCLQILEVHRKENIPKKNPGIGNLLVRYSLQKPANHEAFQL